MMHVQKNIEKTMMLATPKTLLIIVTL